MPILDYQIKHISDGDAYAAWAKTRMIEKWAGKVDYNIRSEFLRKIYYNTNHWKNFSHWRRHWWFGITFLGWGKCADCGKKGQLESHHITYNHIWLEQFFWFDLVNLCHDCHQERHNRRYQGWRTQ